MLRRAVTALRTFAFAALAPPLKLSRSVTFESAKMSLAKRTRAAAAVADAAAAVVTATAGTTWLCLILSTLSPHRAEASFPADVPCGGIRLNQGIVWSTNYPEYPVSKETCSWTLRARSGKVLLLFFDDFSIGSTAQLDIYDGALANESNKLTTYTGESANGVSLILPPVVTVVFQNGYRSGSRGFLFGFKSISSPARASSEPENACFTSLDSGGSFSTPGYPGWYPMNTQCVWNLTACDLAAQIKISFKQFALEDGHDIVTISDGETTRSYTGETLPEELTLRSYTTVTFTSDNLGYMSGFLATFSTVNVDQFPNDGLQDVTQLCQASCPASTQIDETAYCYARDDPHMQTFDGRRYEFQREGVFYLYKHNYAPIAVQAAFQRCSDYATCSCAVAVRFWDEAFIMDRCLTTDSNVRPFRRYKVGFGNLMTIVEYRSGYKISLPNGLEVIIGGRSSIGLIDLQIAKNERGQVKGLCGLYNGDQSDDEQYRCGYQADSAWQTWSVPDDEHLFSPNAPVFFTSIRRCSCGTTDQLVPLPEGIQNTTAVPLPVDERSDATRFSFAAGASESASDNGAAPASDRPWPGQWTEEKALTYCRNYILKNGAIAQCSQTHLPEIDSTDAVENCVQDIYLTGTTDFALTALEGGIEKCLATLTSKRMSISSIVQAACPSECNYRGTCVNGTCRCAQGWLGNDCSINVNTAPALRKSQTTVNCVVAQSLGRVCLEELVFGGTFYKVNNGSLVCRVSASLVVVGSNGAPTGQLTLLNEQTTPATYESPSAVICRIQLPPANRTGSYRVSYSIRVSNNYGLNVSNPIVVVRTFEAGCGGRVNVAGVLLTPNYPQLYRNNALCNWTLAAKQGEVVSLNFNFFTLENGFDYLTIYDRGLPVERFSGIVSKHKRNYANSVTAVFASDNSNAAKGFNISVTSSAPSATCGGTLTGNGVITSPGYPGNYPNYCYCLWILTASSASRIRLHFTAFKTEENYDTLKVYGGASGTLTFTGSTIPSDAVLGSSAHMIFRSDDEMQYSGFSISFTSETTVAG